MEHLEQFRRGKDEFFATPHAPLDPERRQRFTGLNYYPPNPDLVVTATLDRDVDDTPVVMQTTTGGQRTYHRAGVMRFSVEGRPAAVTLFASEGQTDLFLPFRDATNRDETYPAGRYLEVPAPGPDGAVTVDFNYAYNPFCAYNDAYECPLPPPENWLDVPIRAGEKRF